MPPDFWGRVGAALCDLSFVAALVAALAYGLGARAGAAQAAWQRLGRWAFLTHVGAVVGILAVLLSLLATHQYQYHYVWAHSSNELPMHFLAACLWEGQEGSFLIWALWHALLGLMLLQNRRLPRGLHAAAMAVVASVQAILATMILGVQVGTVGAGIAVALALGAAAWRLWRLAGPLRALGLAGALVAACFALLAARGLGGYWHTGFWAPLLLPATALLGVFLFLLIKNARRLPLPGLLAGGALAALALTLCLVPLGAWQVGSSPFLLLRQALPNEEVFAANPNFIPLNGNGLNPLLQNYWMVIHPPTLFLGFALTLFPFALAVAGLWQRDYAGWLRPAAPWLLAAVAVLGLGILMGAYWAYETLNFGGYWNWDPVENASLVPWLTGVAALHTALAYRAGRTNLRLTLALVLATFLLILYSTFLTRSGILGDASVHSFTDLGLSGQLLLLLLGYALAVALLAVARWPQVPGAPAAHKQAQGLFTRQTFLFLGALTLTFAAVQIGMVTSLPVFNKLFGTRLAPPGQVQLFYYKWNVWLATAVAALSAVGQVLFWFNQEKKPLSQALSRPFAIAAGAALALMGYWLWAEWDFVYNRVFHTAWEAGRESAGALRVALSTLGYALLFVADELLLLAALFSLAANADVMLALLRRSRAHWQRMGGGLAHMGFALLLLGALFSSGYERTVSINFNPQELGAAFPEDARADNVLLVRGQEKFIPGYRVVYRGKRQAQAPIGPLEVVFQNEKLLKVAFADATGERFGIEFPAEFFRQTGFGQAMAGAHAGTGAPAAPANVDLGKLRAFVQANLRIIEPKLLNARSLYTLEFVPLKGEDALPDSTRAFTLYPEAEVNDRMGLVSHPDTRHTAAGDLYVHVTSIPQEEADTAAQRVRLYEGRLAKGDTLRLTGGAQIVFDNVVAVEGEPAFARYQTVARAKLRVLAKGMTYEATPHFLIAGQTVDHLDDVVRSLGLNIRFEGIAPAEGKIVLRVEEKIEPDDYITFKALYKPWIGVLWLGAIVLTVGVGLAGWRRGREAGAAAPEHDAPASGSTPFAATAPMPAPEAPALQAEAPAPAEIPAGR